MKSYLLKTITLTIICFSIWQIQASAQFSSSGEDPARVRWNYMYSPHYKLIYPRGLDSLATVYGTLMEKYRMSESLSSGLVPGEGYRKRTQVIIHPFHGVSNGSVTWAPKRVDLFALPDAYNPDPMPWEKSLAVHESRHLAQMQFGYKGWLKPLTWILGDMAVGAYSALWPSTWLLEGDAVTAETALTQYGRGRSADFLNYYMMAFDEGDMRNWYKWRYGSYRFYAPDHYALGYMTVAGVRYFYGDPLFTDKYFERISRNPFRFFNTQKTVRQISGLRFKDSWSRITDGFHEMWQQEAELRKPFTQSERIQDEGKWFSTMSGGVVVDGQLYGIASGIAEASSLVKLDPDTQTLARLRAFSSYSSALKYGDGKLWWSESVPDPRWSLKMTSRIRYYDIDKGKTGTLTKKRRLFNPEPAPDGSTICAVQYPVKGGTAIVLIDPADGKILRKRSMPDSLQAVEVCFHGNSIVFNTVSEAGSGIFSVNADLSGDLECLCTPLPVSIGNLRTCDGEIWFSSDRDGTRELYSINPDSRVIRQHTSLPYGGENFIIDKDNIYFASLSRNGKHMRRADRDEGKQVDFRDIHHYRVADTLTSQEKRLAAAKGMEWVDTLSGFTTDFSQPKKYVKAANVLRFHSWAPVYFNYDNVRSLSGDFNYETASVGATALFQNSLGTAWGSVGYSFHNDPYSYVYDDGSHKYRHSGHILFTYSGLYPVFEFSADFNDRAAVQYQRRKAVSGSYHAESVTGTLLNTPSLKGSVKVYVPLSFSSGGWSRGLIPQVRYTICNDLYDKSLTTVSFDGNFSGTKIPHVVGYKSGDNVYMQTVHASIRGYSVRNVPASGTYPRYGIGAEVGYSARIRLSDMFSSSAYFYGYGYLPGFTLTQGLKLTAKYQHQFEAGVRRENSISMVPRGFSGSDAEYFIRNISRNHLKITADYAIPIWVGDISWLSPVAYIKNFEITPHFDWMMFSSGKSIADNGLFSAGASIVAKLANLLWVPFDCSIGITADWNGGPAFNKMKKSGCHLDNHYIGLVFNIDL